MFDGALDSGVIHVLKIGRRNPREKFNGTGRIYKSGFINFRFRFRFRFLGFSGFMFLGFSEFRFLGLSEFRFSGFSGFRFLGFSGFRFRFRFRFFRFSGFRFRFVCHHINFYYLQDKDVGRGSKERGKRNGTKFKNSKVYYV